MDRILSAFLLTVAVLAEGSPENTAAELAAELQGDGSSTGAEVKGALSLSWARQVKLSGGHYLFALTAAGVDMYDVRDPEQPVWMHLLPSPPSVHDPDMRVDEQFLYIKAGSKIWVYDFSEPQNGIKSVSRVDNEEFEEAWDAFRGNLAVILKAEKKTTRSRSVSKRGFVYYNIDRDTEFLKVETTASLFYVTLVGNHWVYAKAIYDKSVLIFDSRNLMKPAVAIEWPRECYVSKALYLPEDTLLLASATYDRICSVDVTKPEAPEVLGRWEGSQVKRFKDTLAVRGEFLSYIGGSRVLLAKASGEWAVVDFAERTEPVEVKQGFVEEMNKEGRLMHNTETVAAGNTAAFVVSSQVLWVYGARPKLMLPSPIRLEGGMVRYRVDLPDALQGLSDGSGAYLRFADRLWRVDTDSFDYIKTPQSFKASRANSYAVKAKHIYYGGAAVLKRFDPAAGPTTEAQVLNSDGCILASLDIAVRGTALYTWGTPSNLSHSGNLCHLELGASLQPQRGTNNVKALKTWLRLSEETEDDNEKKKKDKKGIEPALPSKMEVRSWGLNRDPGHSRLRVVDEDLLFVFMPGSISARNASDVTQEVELPPPGVPPGISHRNTLFVPGERHVYIFDEDEGLTVHVLPSFHVIGTVRGNITCEAGSMTRTDDRRLFVACFHRADVLVFDVSSPETPRALPALSSFPQPESPFPVHLAASGNLLFAAGPGYLTVLDFNTPTHPSESSSPLFFFYVSLAALLIIVVVVAFLAGRYWKADKAWKVEKRNVAELAERPTKNPLSRARASQHSSTGE